MTCSPRKISDSEWIIHSLVRPKKGVESFRLETIEVYMNDKGQRTTRIPFFFPKNQYLRFFVIYCPKCVGKNSNPLLNSSLKVPITQLWSKTSPKTYHLRIRKTYA